MNKDDIWVKAAKLSTDAQGDVGVEVEPPESDRDGTVAGQSEAWWLAPCIAEVGPARTIPGGLRPLPEVDHM